MIAVYIHIPYCRTLCPYCDFARIPLAGSVPTEFLDGLRREISAYDGPNEAATLFLGGGTPSTLAPQDVERILSHVVHRFTLRNPEITIEANPDDVTPALADAWRHLGVNRVSLGVQSFDDRVLRYLGRRHDADVARRACAVVAERFQNWAMDLIFGPTPVAAWEATLEECAAFHPAHVSVYGLTYEPGTPFGARAHEAVDDDTYLALYRKAQEVLASFNQYEVSNFARPGYACRHNLTYWRNENYIGFGPGAYSFLGGVRSRNTADVAEYLAHPGKKTESFSLSLPEIKVETLIQHFRLRAGLPKAYYMQRFGNSVRADYAPALDALIERQLLQEDAASIRPTKLGFELNNEIGLALIG